MSIGQRCAYPPIFLSTLSLRRATFCVWAWMCRHPHFYPRSPCGERQFVLGISILVLYFYPRSPCGERPYSGPELDDIQIISIHALLAESDSGQLQNCYAHMEFLSTLSLRRATGRKTVVFLPLINFYPRSPCGERRILFCSLA